MGRNQTGREPHNTSIQRNLITNLKELVSKMGKSQNDLVEEALKDLMIKNRQRVDSRSDI